MIDYNMLLSDRIMQIQPSGIRKFFDILEQMKDAISLGVGEPDFVTPWPIRDAGIYALEKGHTRYTSNAGLLDLRREISAYQQRRFGLTYDPKTQVVVTVGGSEGIDLALRCLVNPGDEVIVPSPSFVCYGPLAGMAGGTVVYCELTAEDNFRLTPARLRAAITPRTKVLVLPFPCNPTGGIMSEGDLHAIAETLRETNIAVVSDEIYAELTYGRRHVSIASLPDLYARTIVVGGFSKSHAMTGWRMGYVLGPQEIISQMLKLHQFGIMSAPTVSQYAAVEAMRHGDEAVERMRDEYDGRRRFLLGKLRGLGLPCFEPEGAFYLFPDIRPTGLSAEEFCERFLLEEKVAVIPGSAFGPGGEGFVRCCYATSMHELQEAMVRLERFLARLGKGGGAA